MRAPRPATRMRGGNGDQQDRRSSGVRYGAVSRAPGAAGAGIRCAARMFARRDSGSCPIVRPGVRQSSGSRRGVTEPRLGRWRRSATRGSVGGGPASTPEPPGGKRPDRVLHAIASPLAGPAAARAVSQRRAVTTRAGVFGGMGRQGIPRLGDLGGAGLVRRVCARLVRFEDAGLNVLVYSQPKVGRM